MTFSFATDAVHAGRDADPQTGAIVPPLSLSTTFKQSAPGVHKGYEYSRSDNPSRKSFETAVATLEKAKYGLAFASGSATSMTLLNLLKKDSHVVCVNDVYGGTNRYLSKVAVNIGIESTFVDLFDPENVSTAIRPNTGMIWIETPTNPTLRLVDIQAVVNIVKAKSKDILVIVDNTFLSPYFQKPLLLGADIVMHSATKYLNGHCDALLGVIATNRVDLYEKLKFLQNAIGAVPAPFDCFMASRGLQTLHLRMKAHEANAFQVAKFLESHPAVERVIYPGLTSHPQHELAKRQQSGFGGMISFGMKTRDKALVNQFFSALRIFILAESLGGVESLIEIPSIMTHGALKPEEREALGITDSFVRLSIGIEDAADLVEDLKQALDVLCKKQ